MMDSPLLSTPPTLPEYRQNLQQNPPQVYGGYAAEEVLAGSGSDGSITPFFSIITVVKDQTESLKRTIESVLQQRQSFQDYEYIIIDGDSDSPTIDILQQYSSQIACWMSQPDLGISDAFNKGIALARGQFIALLNADDWYTAEALQQMFLCWQRALDRSPAGTVILCGGMQIWERQAAQEQVWTHPRLFENTVTVAHPAVFCSRQVYRELGLFRLDFRYAMDYEQLLRAKIANVPFVTCEQVIVNMDKGGVSDKHWLKAKNEAHKAKCLHRPLQKWGNRWFHLMQILKGIASQLLRRSGARAILQLYHHCICNITNKQQKNR